MGGVLSICLSHVHPTGSVAVMASGMGRGVLSIRLSHVHPTGSVAVMASGMGRRSVYSFVPCPSYRLVAVMASSATGHGAAFCLFVLYVKTTNKKTKNELEN
ncbi:hypothetical protein AVEN_117440-1 [Araneus ventricosus]|uniref:Uncharacterized protein n=1 Tax=Araneus ventricosus TaxID=182803 RepID=A0A4Y2X7J8_ARAVE|nr:hypothetical protein AVEN_117440-1 [Araneus ventricosus]